ncbi:Interferon-induced GTP-binding protein Mx2 [Colletotrichum tanaceti]|uniref:Interferon-induced GTP-binding protein Mx2 n=1 Tax=Colletotrichum tanaceti TaxID=1306861 RepID=A0A4U6XDJ3_9PEZI|nr:Interferon-induced GTP-binding protein Mx2 [Colletotrichum tanaceti]KAJ0167242.1 Interferon-induced GTP-binding protein Mx2 [Colletotrichum tanaceti]TKW53848.1 Interferon-induced GTP-binding protein Mx2 [Colletotrichum tanaceti]
MMSPILLESEEHRDLLDNIDKLRSQGISRYVDLPEIIVCGEQSAGKSSVLEAISGMSFPTKDNLCTRFATELVLRRDAEAGISISIIPAPERTAAEVEQISKFRPRVDIHEPFLGQVVEDAKSAMGLSDKKVFSTDILHIEIRGPSQPHLTMVDLPGLFRAGNQDQSLEDATIVREMVRRYMARPRSIILAVVSAKSDFALQEVTELARKIDPRGIRTLGLVTKPDTLDAGSDSEAAYLRLVQNADVKFRLGWHVLKNRSFQMRDASAEDRDRAEETFFGSGIWTSISPRSLGIKSLKPRLSNVLKNQILLQLPSLLADIERNLEDCRQRLKHIGPSRRTVKEQRQYLLRTSQEFSTLMKAAADGNYGHAFFGSALDDDGYGRRLRAVVQNTLTAFAADMDKNGRSRVIAKDASQDGLTGAKELSRLEYIEEVKTLMRRSRGCELPGTYSPTFISELFAQQCRPWWPLATKATDDVMKAVRRETHTILTHVADGETSELLMRFVGKTLDSLEAGLDKKMSELIKPHTDSHPITYNHYLTDNVQKAQAARRRVRMEDALKGMFGPDLEKKDVFVKPTTVLTLLLDQTEVDMEVYACENAIDYMEAYYKVAMKRFIDDVSVLAVEACLIQFLPDLFTPNIVYDMTDEQVQQLAAERPELTEERAQFLEREGVLEVGLQTLRLLSRHIMVDTDALGDFDPDETTTLTEPGEYEFDSIFRSISVNG